MAALALASFCHLFNMLGYDPATGDYTLTDRSDQYSLHGDDELGEHHSGRPEAPVQLGWPPTR